MFIYKDAGALLVVPYVIAIGIMALIAWIVIAYFDRSIIFRLLMIIASGLFVFSDSLIGKGDFRSREFEQLF